MCKSGAVAAWEMHAGGVNSVSLRVASLWLNVELEHCSGSL